MSHAKNVRISSLLLFALWSGGRALHADDNFTKSVVKIFVTSQNVDFYEPWKPGAEMIMQGSGCILSGQRILTTAHMIDKGHYIEVQKFGQTDRSVAKVEELGYDTDLAVLSVDDAKFWDDTKPVEFGDIPVRDDKLLIQGPDELSIKEDSVLGVNIVFDDEGGRSMPAILSNSAVDPGNEGAPVFSKGKLVGIPFNSSGKPDKTGSLIPVNVIQRFFRAIANGRHYDGFPEMGFATQELKNPALRAAYQVPDNVSGVIVSKVVYQSSADGLLQEGDVLTQVDGHDVDNEGNINLPKIGRLSVSYLECNYIPGESMNLQILRSGKSMSLKMPLKPMSRLLAHRSDNVHPTYYMVAGLVFVPLTDSYFGTDNFGNFKPELQDLYYHGLPSPERSEVVILSHVLPHAINQGYERLSNAIVTKVNGQDIRNMKDVVDAFSHPVGNEDVVDIDDHEWFGSTVVIDASRAPAATDEILNTFKISNDRSKDLD